MPKDVVFRPHEGKFGIVTGGSRGNTLTAEDKGLR